VERTKKIYNADIAAPSVLCAVVVDEIHVVDLMMSLVVPMNWTIAVVVVVVVNTASCSSSNLVHNYQEFRLYPNLN
jgi:hypothetical protein